MIRKGQINDALEIGNIKINTWRKTYFNIFPDEFLDKLNIETEEQKYIKSYPNRKVKVYEKDGQIIAYCYYGNRKEEILPDYTGEVFALYVKNDCQDKGVGTKLLQDAINDLAKENKKILLWCAKENYRAISFYKKNGLKVLTEDIENIGGKNVEKTALGINLNKEKSYTIKKSANYITKGDSTAIYANPDLIVLNNETNKWFNQILNKEDISNIPQKFIDYLIRKEVIESA